MRNEGKRNVKMGIGRTALLAGAFAIGGALVPSAAASAAAPSDQGQVKLTESKAAAKRAACPKYRFCGWKGGNGSGKGFSSKYSQPRLGKYGYFHNISSASNRTKKVVCIYPKTYYKGHFKGYGKKNVWIKAHTKGNLPKAFNNKIGSFKFAKSGKGC